MDSTRWFGVINLNKLFILIISYLLHYNSKKMMCYVWHSSYSVDSLLPSSEATKRPNHVRGDVRAQLFSLHDKTYN